MLTLETARACVAHLAASLDVTIIEPDAAAMYFDGATSLLSLIPGLGPLIAQARAPIADAQERVSVTLPTPWGTAVLLSRSAVADGPTYLGTSLHELVHAKQAVDVGPMQSAVDYLSSGELRAFREADASGVGMWAKYVVTGKLPAVDDASVLRSSLYHLDAPDKAFAREVVSSLVACAEVGAMPPHRVARQMLAWLRENAPESIAVEAYRAA